MVSFGANLIELQKECKPLLFDLPSVTGSGQWLAGSDVDPHAPSNLDFHCIAIKYFLLVLQVVKALRSKDWSQSNLWWGKCLQWTIVGSIITYVVKRSDRSRIFLVGMYATISRRLTAFYSTIHLYNWIWYDILFVRQQSVSICQHEIRSFNQFLNYWFYPKGDQNLTICQNISGEFHASCVTTTTTYTYQISSSIRWSKSSGSDLVITKNRGKRHFWL